jgi:hypothetical protein
MAKRTWLANSVTFGERAIRVILGLLIAFVIFAIPVALASWLESPPSPDVVGNEAGGSPDCQLKDMRTVPNHRGEESTLRYANCPGALAQGSGYYVVFVHRVGEPNTASNLVFQYEPGFWGKTLSPAPAIVWTDEASLRVSASGVLDRVVRQRPHIGRVDIDYYLEDVRSRGPNADEP